MPRFGRLTLLTGILLLGGCSTQPIPDADNDSIEDFIFVNELEEMKSLRSGMNDSWNALNDNYAIYEARRKTYLLAFRRTCRGLNDIYAMEADQRRDINNIYARFDTLRGCQIHKIYSITEDQAAELNNIGDAPGADD